MRDNDLNDLRTSWTRLTLECWTRASAGILSRRDLESGRIGFFSPRDVTSLVANKVAGGTYLWLREALSDRRCGRDEKQEITRGLRGYLHDGIAARTRSRRYLYRR